jgi:hypothetical protein
VLFSIKCKSPRPLTVIFRIVSFPLNGSRLLLATTLSGHAPAYVVRVGRRR